MLFYSQKDRKVKDGIISGNKFLGTISVDQYRALGGCWQNSIQTVKGRVHYQESDHSNIMSQIDS